MQSFGSEGRRGGVNEIGPSPHVYELITFRGSDVKDLHVESVGEAAAKAAPPPMPQDPAIMSATPAPVHVPAPKQQLPKHQPRQEPRQVVQVQVAPKSYASAADASRSVAQKHVEAKQNFLPAGTHTSAPSSAVQPARGTSERGQSNRGTYPPRETNTRGGRGGRGGQTSHGAPREQGTSIVVPKTDFDFTSAKLNREVVQKELADSSVDSVAQQLAAMKLMAASGSAYNKKTSFFDDISSDAKSRAEGQTFDRSKIAEMRAIDVDTFGTEAATFRGTSRGRRGRGRGGRGASGARGGFNNGNRAEGQNTTAVR